MVKEKNKTSEKLKHLLVNLENGWNSLNKKSEAELFKFCEEYRQFLSKVKTEREVTRECVDLAEAAEFINLETIINSRKKLSPGDKLYWNVGDKTLILIQIGTTDITSGINIVGGHTDSPRLDLKPRPIYEDSELALLDTHYYGGIKKYQWVTMPLALHGTVVQKNGKSIDISIGEKESDPVFTITDVLPHLGKDQAEKKLSEAITGEGLNVLAGSIPLSRQM